MYFDIDRLEASRSYKPMSGTVLPRPIAWVVTRSPAGHCNAAPFSFFNCFGGHPPVIAIGIGERSHAEKDTLNNIRREAEFVVNLVPEALAFAMTETATDFPSDVDELSTAGLEVLASIKVSVPRIARSPVAYECRLRQILDADGSGHIVLANVLAVHVDDDAVLDRDRCRIDAARLDLIGRMQSPGGYTRTHDTFSIPIRSHAQWVAAHGERFERPAAPDASGTT